MQDFGSPQSGSDKLLVVHAAEAAPEDAGRKGLETATGEIEAAIAGKIRADSRERSAMTQAETVFTMVPESQRVDITAMLEKMAADDRYSDIKAVTTVTGRVFFFSTRHIAKEQAFPRGRVEEAKCMIAEKVRADSLDRGVLTSAGDLQVLATESNAGRVDDVLDGMQTDERYTDIRKVTAANDAVFLYSDRHMAGGYAVLLSRAAAGNRCATVVDTVREDSRLYPRATNTRIFGQKVFGIDPVDLEGTIAEILGREEFGDIRKLVHPSTGGVYLYSSRYLSEAHAFSLMDWEEVGKDDNP